MSKSVSHRSETQHNWSVYSMWHELRVVLHNRENTLVTEAVKTFARQEREYAEGVTLNWSSLSEGLEGMPYE